MDKTRNQTDTLRKSHTLKPTRSQYRPRRIIFFDTETKQEEREPGRIFHTLKLGYSGYYKYEPGEGFSLLSELEFYEVDQFWTWLDELITSKTTTYLVAHNIVFDLTIMDAFRVLPALGWTMDSFYSKGMVSLFRWSREGSKIMGLDNTNFYSMSLAKLGDYLEVPKLEIDFDQTDNDNLMTYCKRDVEIMVKGYESWFNFLDDNRCGAFKSTVSSTAFNTWRHRFMNEKVHIHSDPLALELERASYRGGRTECLYQGYLNQGPYYYLDVNNMYGYLLAEREYPAGLWGSSEEGDLFRLAYKLDRYSVVADVTINTTENWFPYTVNDHTAYPLGEFRTTLTTPELKLCIEKGWIKEVHRYSWYRSAKLFSSYIHEFRELREKYQQEGKTAHEKIVKLLINGLYGKFGQRGMKQEVIGSAPPGVFEREQVYDLEDKIYFDLVTLGGSIFKETKQGESFHSFPAIASHVTAYARLYLYQFANQVPAGHVYYMDTDSLIVDEIGFQALKFYIDPDTLGMLKIELESPWLMIRAPKDYEMKNRTRRKGVRVSALPVGPDSYRQFQWSGLAGIIREGLTGEYLVKELVKHRTGRIWSGTPTRSGWVSPFVLEGSEPVGSVPVYQPVELFG